MDSRLNPKFARMAEKDTFDECMDVLSNAVYVVVRSDAKKATILTDHLTLSEAFEKHQSIVLADATKWRVPKFLGGGQVGRFHIADYRDPCAALNVTKDGDGNVQINDFPALSGIFYDVKSLSDTYKTYGNINTKFITKYNSYIKEFYDITKDYK